MVQHVFACLLTELNIFPCQPLSQVDLIPRTIQTPAGTDEQTALPVAEADGCSFYEDRSHWIRNCLQRRNFRGLA